jgi:Fe-S-cluster containining protein
MNDTLCDRCMALCCHYITIEIDKPTSKRRKDDVRWYLLHEGITLLISQGRWLIKVPTRCSELTDECRCGIYEDRPIMCNEYTTENCDYFTEYEGWEADYLEIETVAEYEHYLESRKRKRTSPKTSARKTSRENI